MENLIGIVLMGGKSSRMLEDKSLINYNGKAQFEFIHELLSEFCAEVYLSVKSTFKSDLSLIFDSKKYQNIGPLLGLISAFESKKSAFLVLAIDYPLIDKSEIENLISERDVSSVASVLYNTESSFFEPFLGIYEESFFEILVPEIQNENYSLQNILSKNKVKKVFPLRNESLKNINSQAEKNEFLTKLR